jgi:hypothetical protein
MWLNETRGKTSRAGLGRERRRRREEGEPARLENGAADCP